MQLLDETGRADHCQIHGWITNATELARESYRNALTTEGSLPYRSEFDAIVRSLTLLTLGHLGCDRETLVSLYRGDPLAAYCCEVRPNHADAWKLVSRLCAFYVAVSDWLTGGYEVRKMCETLLALGEDERREFAKIRHRLSEALVRSADDALLSDDLEYWDGEIPRIVSELQVMRGLVQAGAARQPDIPVNECVLDTLPDEDCLCVIVPLFPAGCEGEDVLALIGFERHQVRAWVRLSRSSLWCRVAKLIASQDVGGNELIYSEVDDIVQNSYGAAGLCFKGLSVSIETINIVDLSSKNVPLSLLEDENGRFVFTMSGPKSRQCIRTAIPRVSFWGPVANGRQNKDWINEQSRTIECESDAGHVTLRYPDVPDPYTLLFGRENPPLVLGHFERWDFDDHLRAGRCCLEARVGRAATRSAFLQYAWNQVDVLHLSTHARAIAGTPEFAHIDMFPEKDRANVVHSFDVLSLDFSRLQLVFLSSCQTKLGSQWTGNEDLSLAWAFRAAGAAAVIGMRWEVSDVAAWYFSHCFYAAWLGERKANIRESFRLAQSAVRQHPYFSKPSLWGAFVLLD